MVRKEGTRVTDSSALLLVLLLTLACASAASGQIRSATFTGAVTDPTKAVVPGATVIVTNQDTNAKNELVTSEAGLFTPTYLPACSYSFEASVLTVR